MARIAIIGGGIIGMTSAVALADAGHAVTVFDAALRREAPSWGNAGLIATERVTPLASLDTLDSVPHSLLFGGPIGLPLRQIGSWAPFAARLIAATTPARFAAGQAALTALLAPALPAWRDLSDRLGQPLLIERGHIVAWESTDTAARGRADWWTRNIGTATVEPVDFAKFARLARVSPRIVAALRLGGTAQVRDLNALADALTTALGERGGRIVRGTAVLEREGARARIAGHDSDLILVAAGISSRDVLHPIGYRVPMVAVRGYHLRAPIGRWPVDLIPLVFEDRGITVTTFADCVQVSGFSELGDSNAPPDPRKWLRLAQHIRELRLPIDGPFARWMGARPTFPDYLPAIGRSHRADNLFYAFGHHHLGLTLAPITARLVTAMIADEPPAIDLTPFSLGRFRRRRT